jgi:cobalt/nickel transport system permease protein
MGRPTLLAAVSAVHDRLLNPYQHRASPIHRLPAAVKLAAATAFIVTIVLLPRFAWCAYAAAGTVLLLVAAASRLSARRLAIRLLQVEPFALGVAVLSLFQTNGLHVFAATLVRSTLCLFCLVLLAGTTRFTDILHVLWRLRVPALLVTTLALMHRYLFLLADEMGRMLRARRSRTFTRDPWSIWRSLATVLAHLFVRSLDRAEHIYAAMCARGWRT